MYMYISGGQKNVSKFQLRYLRKYALLLAEISHSNHYIYHHVVFIHCKLYDCTCSCINIPTASKTKHEVKNCNAAQSRRAMAPGKDTE
jgi:hypothetical protein